MQSFGRRCDAHSGSDKNETRGAGTRRRLNLPETANSFCAHYGGQVAAVAIVSRDRHQVVLADRRPSTAITTSPAAGSATMRVVVGSKRASRAFNRTRSSIQ